MIFVNAFIHANIRTSLGPLRHLVISPQAHRVHHSAAPEHIDTNFGTVFAWWDYLFGTRYHDHHDYPTTGIHDPTFPREDPDRPWAVPAAWARTDRLPRPHPVRSPGASHLGDSQGRAATPPPPAQ